MDIDPSADGYNARVAGAALSDNPFPPESADGRLWAMGWYAADDDANGRG